VRIKFVLLRNGCWRRRVGHKSAKDKVAVKFQQRRAKTRFLKVRLMFKKPRAFFSPVFLSGAAKQRSRRSSNFVSAASFI